MSPLFFTQAIVTKYTTSRVSGAGRIRARCAGGTIIVPWQQGIGVAENHAAAAMALVRKMGWVPAEGKAFEREWMGGGTPDGCGYVFVSGPDSVRCDYPGGKP